MSKKKKDEDLDNNAFNAVNIDKSLNDSELSSKKDSVKKLIKLNQSLQDENSMLRAELKKREEESLQISSFLQRDLDTQQSTILRMTKEAEEIQKKSIDMVAAKDKELQKVKHQYDKLMDIKDEKIKMLESVFKEYERLKLEQMCIEEVVSVKSQEVIELRAGYERTISDMRFQFLEEKMKLQAEEEVKRKRLDEEVEKKAIELLGVKSKEINRQNMELLENIKRLDKELLELGQMRSKLDMENKNLIREKHLNEDSIREYAKQGFLMAKEMKELHQKVIKLEEALTTLHNQYTTEKQALTQKIESDRQNYEAKIEDLNNKLQVRVKELITLQRLSKKILQQRTQLEQFFMESLAHVRNEKIKHELEEQRRKQAEAMEFPPINLTRLTTKKKNQVKSAMMLKIDENTDFSSLDWTDKEKVLKLLFAKINGMNTPISSFITQPPKQYSRPVTNTPASSTPRSASGSARTSGRKTQAATNAFSNSSSDFSKQKSHNGSIRLTVTSDGHQEEDNTFLTSEEALQVRLLKEVEEEERMQEQADKEAAAQMAKQYALQQGMHQQPYY